MRTLKAGILYFLFVFGVGFVLGIIRTLLVVPRLGTRTAELLEQPVMLVVFVIAAKLLTKRLAVPPAPLIRLGMGGIALFLVVVTELALPVLLMGVSVREYIGSRDPVSGAVFCANLCLFAAMPAFVTRLNTTDR